MALEIPYRSIPDMFLKRVAATPAGRAFAVPTADDSAVRWLTWAAAHLLPSPYFASHLTGPPASATAARIHAVLFELASIAGIVPLPGTICDSRKGIDGCVPIR